MNCDFTFQNSSSIFCKSQLVVNLTAFVNFNIFYSLVIISPSSLIFKYILVFHIISSERKNFQGATSFKFVNIFINQITSSILIIFIANWFPTCTREDTIESLFIQYAGFILSLYDKKKTLSSTGNVSHVGVQSIQNTGSVHV
jgi:hypothetical protein